MRRSVLVAAGLGAASAACPCSDTALCERVKPVGPEVYAFSTSTSNWVNYPWTSGLLTSVCAFSGLDPQMMCTAHENGVRVTVLAPYPITKINDETFLNSFIADQIAAAKAGFYDGINFDVESPITTEKDALALTHVMNATNVAMKAALGPDFQVTADLAWSPDCIDRRCYDYTGIGKAVDKVFIMSYDLRSQVWPPAACVAGSNDALELVKQGALNYTTKAGIPPEKMILGVPFYGFDYQCINSAPSPTMQVCQIAQVPYEGAPCSDAAGMPTDYDDIMPLLAKSSTGYKIDHASMTPWFNYIASDGSVHQVVYDDAGSLMLKYAWAKQTGFGGVGMWNIDSLNWESTDPLIHKQTMEMWNALAVFRNVTHTA